MYSHTTLGTADLDRARAFYEPVMAALGIAQPFQLPGSIVFGELIGPKLFILKPFDGAPATVGNGTHIALLAPNRAAVDAFHAAALANGGTDDGPPGPRPHYHANYYGAYVRDPDGNKLQAVCHSGKAEKGA
ncbi:VOC family protein [Sphingomonas sp. LB-2]|uniref:VOC family protein n=1 Tax=Sphingomonas caeni TaxID=2984949 RepID=UPI00222FD37D|nr:VOC family protein [Sphingomonas caeni]MCW3849269.1 VOC family protein [Sphingomonas caeni]